MGEVVNIKPKTRKINYKKHVITITYLVKKEQWRWSFVVSSKLQGLSTSFSGAEREAKKLIDQMDKK